MADNNREMAQSIKDKLQKMSSMVSDLENKVSKSNKDQEDNRKSEEGVDSKGIRDGSDNRLMLPKDLLEMEMEQKRGNGGSGRGGGGRGGGVRGFGHLMRGGRGSMHPGMMMGRGMFPDMMMGRGGRGMPPPNMMMGRGMLPDMMMGGGGMHPDMMMGGPGDIPPELRMMMMRSMGGGGDVGPEMPDAPPVRVLGELLHEQDIVEAYDDALGNDERRIADLADAEATCLRTIYVGNVPSSLSETMIREYFETFGLLESIDLTSKKRLEKSFFKIVAQSSATIDKIQHSRPHVIEGKEVVTKRALLQKDKKVGYMNTNTIYIGRPFSFSYKSGTAGLGYNMSEDEIFDFFRPFGDVIRVKKDDESLGAYITFQDKDVVDKIALLRAFMINGRTVEAEKMYNEEDRDEENTPDINRSGDPEHKCLRKIVVFGLPKEARAFNIKTYFTAYGDIEECFVPHKKETGKTFAIVVFAKAQSVDDVLDARPHKIRFNEEGEEDGEGEKEEREKEKKREVIVKRPQIKGEDRLLADSNIVKFFARTAWSEEPDEISKEAEKYFSQFGTVDRVKVLDKPRKRMGLVTFDDYESAQKVSMLFLHKILNVEVEVQRAFDRKTFQEMKQNEMMQNMMMEAEMANRRMMEDNMRRLQMRMQSSMDEFGGGMGMGGRGGMMGGRARGFGGDDEGERGMQQCIIIEEVPEALGKKAVCNHFSKYGRVKKYQVDWDKKKGYVLFTEDYMTDYCSRKTEQTIGEHNITISKGHLPPQLFLSKLRSARFNDDEDGEDDRRKGNKRTADKMDTGESEEGLQGSNPLIELEDY